MSIVLLSETKASPNRKEEYKINTIICSRNGNKVVIKTANSQSAQNFLISLINKQNLSSDFFGENAEIVKGNYVNDQVEYPYFESPSLESLISDAIIKGDCEFGISYIHDYCNFIQKLPIKKCIPKDFISEFNVPLTKLSGPHKCFSLGIIDLIPANILIRDNRWYIIDHEWTFTFPVPIDFLIYRSIYSLMINLQKTIQLNVTRQSKVVLFQGFGPNKTFIPISWLSLLNSLKIPIITLNYLEFQFKKRIFINMKLGRLRLNKRPRIFEDLKPSTNILLPWIMKKNISGNKT